MGRSAEAEAAALPAALDPEPADLRLRVDPAVSHAHLRPGADAPHSRVRSTPNAAATEPAQRRSPARQPMQVRHNTPVRPPSCMIAANPAAGRVRSLAERLAGNASGYGHGRGATGDLRRGPRRAAGD